MVGCSSLKSAFDSTYLLWSSDKRAENVKTPPEFVVSFEEVHSLIHPLQKFGWYIYADSNSYFLVETQTLIPGFYVNSNMARKHGVKIDGKSRETYLYLKESLGNYKNYSFEKLREALKRKT